MTCIPFVSVKRSILGSASASGFGGGGAAMRSVRPVQKVEAAGPAGLAGADSYCTSIEPGDAGGFGGALAAQPNDSRAGSKIDAATGGQSSADHFGRPRRRLPTGGAAACRGGAARRHRGGRGAPGGTSVTRVRLLSTRYLRATRCTSAAVTAR